MKGPTSRRRVSIVGLGNWGSSLAHALRASGVPLHEVIISGDGRRAGVPRATWARGLPLTSLKRATLEANVLWLCVPDAAILPVTRSLVRRAASLGFNLEKRLVIHSSGALGTEVLESAALAGAAIASVHPVMSFPNRTPVSLRGVSFGVEADASVRRILDPIIRIIGGRPFPIPTGQKALYHAVGMFSSPLLVSHLAAAQRTAELAGFSSREARSLLEPIARATLDNFFGRGPGGSFSGPIARGDVSTIALHLQALEPHPMLASMYRSLALFALEVLPSGSRKALRRLLRSK